jgi:hypothetical protein
MPVIKSLFNHGGKKNAKTGLVNLHSYNVCPTTIVAGASGSAKLLDVNDFKLFDFFYVEQVGGATDEIALPDDAPVGTRFSLYINEIVIIQTETDASEINGVASKGYTCVALDLVHCTKITSSAWIMHKILEDDGAVTSIIPAT